jgi:iron(III) transport system ATP-binding protein
MLTVEKLSLRLGRRFALRDLSLQVAPGQRLAVLGPNGSGKSTLLQLIAGLRAPGGGKIAWADQLLSSERRVVVPPEERGMGLLLQEGVLFPHLDVEANVALGLPRETPRPERAALVDRALAALRLSELRRRSVPSLSGGEQQRVALARALAQSPRVMLLDEPFHSLDGPVKRAVIGELRELIEARRIAAVLVTHDTEEAATFAERILVLREGSLVQEGTMQELHDRPADGWVASLLGEVLSIELARLRRDGISLPELAAEPADGHLSFRPEDVTLTAAGDGPGLEVRGVHGQGATVEVCLSLTDGGALLARVPAHSAPAVGSRVLVRIVRMLPESVREASR